MSRFRPVVPAADTSGFTDAAALNAQSRFQNAQLAQSGEQMIGDAAQQGIQNNLMGNQQRLDMLAMEMEGKSKLAQLATTMAGLRSSLLERQMSTQAQMRGQDIQAATEQRGQTIRAATEMTEGSENRAAQMQIASDEIEADSINAAMDRAADDARLDRSIEAEKSLEDRRSSNRVAEKQTEAAIRKQEAKIQHERSKELIWEEAKARETIRPREESEQFQANLAGFADGQDVTGRPISYEDAKTQIDTLEALAQTDEDRRDVDDYRRALELRFLNDVQEALTNAWVDGLTSREIERLGEKATHLTPEMNVLFREMIASPEAGRKYRPLGEGSIGEGFNFINSVAGSFQSAVSDEQVKGFILQARKMLGLIDEQISNTTPSENN